MPDRRSPRLPGVALALALLAPVPALAAETTGGAEGPAPAGDCALRYHEALTAIRAREFAAMTAALRSQKASAGAGAGPASSPLPAASTPTAPDAATPGLPGVLLFVSPARPRSPSEIAALTAAVALARSKGRSASVASADRDWIAERLREDLADYLGQKPAPFLCNGVGDYLKTLRSYSSKLGPSAGRIEAWTALQREIAERSVTAALDAIHAAKPTASIAPPAAEAAPAAPAPEAKADPQAPSAPAGRSAAKAPEQPVALDTRDDLAHAVERIVGEARAAGLVGEPTGAPLPTVGPLTPAAIDDPLLRRLASERPLVVSGRPLIRERNVRLKVLAAFADIEALSYLLGAHGLPEDPLASTLDATLAAIETAHGETCTCRP